MKKLFYLLLFTLFVFPSHAFLTEILPLPRLVSVLITILFVLFVFMNRSFPKLEEKHRRVIRNWLLLLSYLLAIDIVRNNPTQGIEDFLINISMFFVFYVLIKTKPDIKFSNTGFNNYLQAISLFVIIFGFVQVLIPFINYENILNNAVLIHSVSEHTENYILNEGRITGPFQISIGFSALLAVIFFYFVFLYQESKKRKYIFILVFIVFLSFFTFTRSLTFGLIPVFIITYIAINSNPKRILAGISIFLIFVILLFQFVIPYSETLDARSGSLIEGSFGVKIISIVYGAYGTFNKSPIIGVPKESNTGIIREGAKGFETNIFDKFGVVDTNHNQIVWFFKYYGFIGLAIWLLLMKSILESIFSINNKNLKLFVLSSFVFMFQFSLLHNNSIINDLYFWLIFGFSINSESVDELHDSR